MTTVCVVQLVSKIRTLVRLVILMSSVTGIAGVRTHPVFWVERIPAEG